MIALDGLKTVNDNHGHAAATPASPQPPPSAPSYATTTSSPRLGGDEFGLLLPHCTATAVITRAFSTLDTAGVPASIGWAPVMTEHGLPAVLAEADTCMYATKQQRRPQHAGTT